VRLHRFATPQALARTVARRFVAVAREAMAARGVFRVALAGGSTPQALYEALAGAAIDWSSVEFFWSDERFVPASDPQSNEGMARRALLGRVGVRHVFPMVAAATPEACAARYESLLPAALDLVLLGLGEDGHTASLFPGEPAVRERARKAIAARAPVGVPDRITLSAAYINRARLVWFLVSGAGKAQALARVLHGPEDHDATPAQAVARHAPEVEFFVDAAACSLLRGATGAAAGKRESKRQPPG